MPETLSVNFEETENANIEAFVEEISDKYPDINIDFENAKMRSEKFVEFDDFFGSINMNEFKKLSGDEDSSIKDRAVTGSHREVFTYGNYIIKTPEEGLTADNMLKFEEQNPKGLPIVETIIAVKDQKTSKEFLVEPRGMLFKEYYDANKDTISKEKFLEPLNEFMAKWINAGVVPNEFESYDLNKHLLIFTDDTGKIILKMTDVVGTRKYNKEYEERNLKNHSNEYLKKIDDKGNELIKSIRHDIKTPFQGIMGFMFMLTSSKVNETDKKDYLDKIHQIVQEKNVSRRIKSYTDEIRAELPDQKEKINDYEKELISKYQEMQNYIQKIDINFDNNMYDEFRAKYDSFESVLKKTSADI